MAADVTRLLNRIEEGDPKATEQLLPLVYDELRRLAGAKMAKEKPGHTLQATALVHEAWLELAGTNQQWEGRAHFFANRPPEEFMRTDPPPPQNADAYVHLWRAASLAEAGDTD